jgi:transglutaminase-like putative cysteine protease
MSRRVFFSSGWRAALALAVVSCIASVGIGRAAAQEELSPKMPITAEKSNPVTYDVDFSAVVTAPAKTKKLRVWMPLPQTDASQEIVEGQIYSFPINVKPTIDSEPVHGNRFAYFEFDAPEGAQMIRHTFKATAYDLKWNIDPKKVQKVEKWPESFAPYLRGEDQSVVVNDKVRQLLGEVLPEQKDPFENVSQIIAWTNANMKYSHEGASLAASSQHAIETRGGHCSDYHGLCAAFGRALGYPTRVTYGINPFPKASPSHCKLEVFLPPYGWVSFDVSETQKLVEQINKDEKLSAEEKVQLVAAANRRLLSGFRDNTWIIQTRGTDYDLAPPGAKRAPIARTVYVEADGVPLKEPDPSSKDQKGFAWMTLHHYKPSKEVKYPFKDVKSLEAWKTTGDVK